MCSLDPQLCYDYNYANLITYLQPCDKITDVKCKVMDIIFPHHILNNITSCLVGGCIRHQSF